jgi:hypothetical protein
MSHKHLKHQNKSQEIPKEVLFDLIPKNLSLLGDVIRKCVAYNITLKLYSSITFKHPGISMTQIPGLKNLFVTTCLEHGLLGYLDWFKEKNPSSDTIILNNVIIITLLSIMVSDTDISNDINTSIIHEINEKQLNFIRKQSREKFNQIINQD